MPEIKRVSYRHDGIINWLIANPHRTLGECAFEHGYTQAWLSCIVHSDMFQALYQERAQALGVEVVHSVKNLMTRVAVHALERTEEMLYAEPSERFVGDTRDNMLQMLGFVKARPETAQHQHMHVHVPGELLEEARERAAQRKEVEGEVLQPA